MFPNLVQEIFYLVHKEKQNLKVLQKKWKCSPFYRPFYRKHKITKCPYTAQTIHIITFITEQDFTESLDSKLMTIQLLN